MLETKDEPILTGFCKTNKGYDINSTFIPYCCNLHRGIVECINKKCDLKQNCGFR